MFYARLEKKKIKINLVIQYQHKEILEFRAIENGVVKALEKMLLELDNL